MIIFLTPVVGALTSTYPHFDMIKNGGYLTAISPFSLAVSSSIPAACVMVILLSLGESVWSPRVYDYTMSIAPEGKEATFAALATAPLFLAKVPVGLLSGYLISKYMPEQGPTNGQMLWLIIGLVTLTSPVLITLFERCIREPEPVVVVVVVPVSESTSSRPTSTSSFSSSFSSLTSAAEKEEKYGEEVDVDDDDDESNNKTRDGKMGRSRGGGFTICGEDEDDDNNNIEMVGPIVFSAIHTKAHGNNTVERDTDIEHQQQRLNISSSSFAAAAVSSSSSSSSPRAFPARGYALLSTSE